MSATAARQSTFQACAPAEEAYCAPWDLKRQEEKFQYLNGHRPKSPSTIRTVPNRAIIHPFSSEHTPCDQNPSFVSCQLSPPVLPPLPPGGLVPASSGILHHSSRSSLTDHRTVPSQPSDYPRHCIPSNQSSLRNYPAPAIPLGDNLLLTDDSQPMSFQAALLCYQHLTATSQYDTQLTAGDESPLAYEQPWDTRKACFINDLSSTTKPLRQLSTSEDRKQWTTSTFSRLLPCRQRTSSLEDTIGQHNPRISLDRYFWYHYNMSRRHAEHILHARRPGSFLVRQSESGNQNDYSLSIRTTRHCMHMRICHTAGVFILGECSRPFADIPQMIEYFSQISVPIRGAAHMRLGTPVLRCEILSSSLSSSHQHHCQEDTDDLL